MAHRRWVNLGKGAKQVGPKSDLGLDDGRIAEGESVDQTWPGLEAVNAPASNVPAVDDSFSGIVGGRHLVLFKEQAVRGSVITQAKQELMQARQGGR